MIWPCVVGAVSVFEFFFFKQKTAYEMRISDWSSDVCSSDLYAQLCRRMDFKRQAQVFTIASVASAAAALAGALAGLGVWTLVLAPIVLFTVRAGRKSGV